MSWQAAQYARSVLEQNAELRLGARLVLMLCAERANRDRGETYAGGWLADATAMHPSSVRRSLYELESAGVVALRSSPGKATVVRFPLAGAISTPRADGRGVVELDPAPRRAPPRAQARATPRPGARNTELLPSNYPDVISPDREFVALCTADGCACEGTGWLFVDDDERGRGYVTPCASRSTGSAGQALKASGGA